MQSGFFALARRKDDPNRYSDAGLVDFYVYIFVVTSVMASYFSKVSVRVDLQRAGFAIPGFLGPIAALIFVFTVDVMDYNYFILSSDTEEPLSANFSVKMDDWDWIKIEETESSWPHPNMGYNDYYIESAASFSNPIR